MPTPLQIIDQLLSVSPRDQEFLLLPSDAATWSDADKRAVAGVLLEAAQKRAEARAPYLLPQLLPKSDSDAALRDLLNAQTLAVRHAAATALESATPDEIRRSLLDPLIAGHGGLPTLLKVARLLLLREGEPALVAALGRATDREAQKAIVTVLWDARRLADQQRTWWAGLGLLHDRLQSQVDSIARPAVDEFRALLTSGAPIPADAEGQKQPPPELWAVMQDVMNGKPDAPIDPAPLAALSPEQKQALVVFAAKEAEGFDNPRGLAYVWELTGGAHRDLFAQLAKSSKPALASAAQALVQKRDAN